MTVVTPSPDRFNVLGVGISAISLSQATKLVIARAQERPASYVCVTGVHGVMEAQRHPAFGETLNRAFLVTPDGMPMVWLGKWNRLAHVTRVYGPDLVLAVCDQGRKAGLRHFFYGGNTGVADELASVLSSRFPGLSVAGTYTPPFRSLTDAEQASLAQQVAETRPDIIWVGLSTPKQELFMVQQFAALPTGLLIGVGAAFDFHTHRVRQAPRWIQRSGFEWLYRMIQEPRRLWRRYLVNNSAFVFSISLQLLGLRKYPLKRSPVQAFRKNSAND